MAEERVPELRTLFEKPELYSKILKELSITYYGVIKVREVNNQIEAFTVAVKRIYSIGTNSNLPLKPVKGIDSHELRSLSFSESENNCINKLRAILDQLSNQTDLKKRFAIPEDWRNRPSIQGDFYTLEFLSYIFNVPIKVISQTAKTSEVFEQNIINPELLAQRPGIDLIALWKDELYVVHVLVSRESELQRKTERALEIEQGAIKFKESEKTRLKKLVAYYKKNFAINDKIIDKVELCVRDKAPISIEPNIRELTPEIVSLKKEFAEINETIDQSERKLEEPFIFTLVEDGGIKLRACRPCGKSENRLMRLQCGCWYHQGCLLTFMEKSISKGKIETKVDAQFVCDCESSFPLQFILSLKCFQDIGYDSTFYSRLGQAKCFDCFLFYPAVEVFPTQEGSQVCQNCMNKKKTYCRYCTRNYKTTDYIIPAINICQCCLFEFAIFNRYPCFNFDIQPLLQHFNETKCTNCGETRACFCSHTEALCYECLSGSVSS